MALKVELKPNERIIIGNVVLRNADSRIRFFIEGHAPILREKDILTAETADTPAKNDLPRRSADVLGPGHQPLSRYLFRLVRDFLGAAPSALPLVAEINNLILSSDIYKALKASKKLIEYEAELLDHALRG